MVLNYRIAGVVVIGAIVLAAVGVERPGHRTSAVAKSALKDPAAAQAALNELRFVENRGQWPQNVRFLARTAGLNVWLTDKGLTYEFFQNAAKSASTFPRREGKVPAPTASRSLRVSSHVVKVDFVGANPGVALGVDRKAGYENYLIGKDRSKWVTGIRSFSSARIKDLYRGIDLVTYFDAKTKLPRYDLVVHPGANAGKIAMRYSGAKDLRLVQSGGITYDTSLGQVQERDLVAYQPAAKNGESVSRIPARMQFDTHGAVAFALGHHDRSRTLVIDPIVWSTFISGEDTINGRNTDLCGTLDGFDLTTVTGLGTNLIARDSSGALYVAGTTQNNGTFPVSPGAFQSVQAGPVNGFVFKLSPDGKTRIWATFYGGSNQDTVNGLALNSNGEAYIVGNTVSPNLPTTANAVQSKPAGGNDAFVAHLSADGTRLLYGSYFGGSGDDYCYSIALDASNNVFLCGATSSGTGDFPTSPGAFDSIHNNRDRANFPLYGAWLAKISETSGASFATFLAGPQEASPEDAQSMAYAVAVDSGGAAYVVGTTNITSFPSTPGVYQPALGLDSNGDAGGDAFVQKFNPDGTLNYSTYFGGGFSHACATCVAVDASGAVYFGGYTRENLVYPDFPTTANAFQRSGILYDLSFFGFLAKLSPDASTCVYSTLLGGVHRNYESWPVNIVKSLTLDAQGDVYAVGTTMTPDFPTTYNAVERYYAGGATQYSGDAFLVEMSPDGSNLLYGTYLGDVGGTGAVDAHGVVLDGAGSAYLAGYASAPMGFPTTAGAFQTGATGHASVFVTDINMVSPPVALSSVALSKTVVNPGDTVNMTIKMSAPVVGTQSVSITYSTPDMTALNPSGVIFLNGQSSEVVVLGTPSQLLGANETVTITVSCGNVSKSVVLTIDGQEQLLSLVVSPGVVAGGANSTGYVTINTPAPSGGLQVSVSSDSGFAVAPTSVSIAAGAKTANFPITTSPVATGSVAQISATVNGVTKTAPLTVNSPALLAVTVAPTIVTGGSNATGTVILGTVAPSSGLVITLSSDSAFAVVPASVTVLGGAKSATFTVTTKAVGVKSVATLSGTSGGVTKTVQLTVNPPSLISVLVSPTVVIGGANSTGTVNLGSAAPSGGLVVPLASDSAFAVVQASMTIAGGAKSGTFPITTSPVATQSVATISATFNGTTKSVPLTVNPPSLLTVYLSPTIVTGGAGATGTVTLGTAAPTVGLAISLASDSSFAAVGATVTVAGGAKTATFPITTSAVPIQSIATISASFNGVTKSAKLTVNPPVLTLVSVAPTTVAGGLNATGTVVLGSVAPSVGMTVSLGSDSSFASVPASVTVVGGAKTATFPVTTSAVTASSVATISATLNGTTKTAKLTVTPPTLLAVTMSPTIVTGGANATGTVLLGSVAPTGGTTVTLASDSSFASVPASVLIPAGAKSMTFPVTTSAVSSSSVAAISGMLAGVTKTVQLTVNPPVLVSLTLSPTTVISGATSTGTVTLGSVAPSAGTTVTLASDSAFAPVPASVTVLGGAKTATFPIVTTGVSTSSIATISATLASVTKTAKLTVTPPALTAVSVNPTSVVGGVSSTGTVTLSGVAPSSGIVVTLSSNSASAVVPPNVTVASGASTAMFTVTTSDVTVSTSATISATLGTVTKTATLTLTPVPASTLTLSPATVEGGEMSVATITLGVPAGVGGQVVALTSSDFYAYVPSTVTIGPGSTNGAFAVLTPVVSASSNALITAAGIGVANLTVVPSGYQPGSPWPKRQSNSLGTGLGLGSGSNGLKKWSCLNGGGNGGSAAIASDGTIYAETISGIVAITPSGVQKWSYGVYSENIPSSSAAIGADGTIYAGAHNDYVVALNPVDGSIKWQYKTGAVINSSPVIGTDGTVYIGSEDDYIYALNPADGSLKWRYLTGSYVDSSPAIGVNGTIYVGSDDDYIYALNAADGSLKWKYQTGSSVVSSPAIGQDGTLYVGSEDHYIYAIDPVAGALKWKYQTGDMIFSSPAVAADGTIYIGSVDDYVYALNSLNGSLKWKYLTGGAVEFSPAIASDGTIYIGSNDHNVYALSPADGTVKWTYLTNNFVSSPAIGADGTVYVNSGGYLYALGTSSPWSKFNANNRNTGLGIGYGSKGTQKWLVSGSGTSSPTIASDGTIYSASGSTVLATNPDGSAKWSFPTGGAVFSCCAVAQDGTIYVGSGDGNLYAITSLGAQKWSFLTGGQVQSSPAIGSGGTIYVGSRDGYLYAINPDGSLKWSYSVGQQVFSSPAIAADGTIYVGSGSALTAVNPNGSMKWRVSGGAFDDASPAIGMDGTIYFAESYLNKICAYNPNGTLNWTFSTGNADVSSPAVALDGTIYAGSLDGNLYAINPDGTQKWAFLTSAQVTASPAIGADGTVYVGSSDGSYYAVTPSGSQQWMGVVHGGATGSPAIGLDGTVYVDATTGLYALGLP